MLPYLLYSSPLHLLLSSYIMHVPGLILIIVSLPVLHACAHDTVFNTCSFGSIDTRVLIPARHLAFTTPLFGGFLTLLDPHVQIPEFGACEFFQLLIKDAQL